MLRRWTAWHEDWKEDVGCVAVETGDGLVFFDPLDPPEDLPAPEHVFITVFFHARGAVGNVWAPKKLVRRLANRGVLVTHAFEPGDELPGGIQCFQTVRDGEVVYWVPDARALVVGDVLLGKPEFRLCPKRWLGGGKTHDDLKDSLRPLLELPIEQVLVSHGEPVLEGGREALAALLRG